MNDAERERLERRDELVRLVRELLPASFVVVWDHSSGPHSTCTVGLRLEAVFSIHDHTPRAVVAELVDVARCHVLRMLGSLVTEGRV